MAGAFEWYHMLCCVHMRLACVAPSPQGLCQLGAVVLLVRVQGAVLIESPHIGLQADAPEVAHD